MKFSSRHNTLIVGLIFSLVLLSLSLIFNPLSATAGSGFTDTPEPTVTMAPTLTPPAIEPDPIIFDTPVPTVTIEPITITQEPTNPIGLWDSASWINRCLLGAVIVGALIFMFLVVFGVIQRMQPDERKN